VTIIGNPGARAPRRKVFLLLFLQKKKFFCLGFFEVFGLEKMDCFASLAMTAC